MNLLYISVIIFLATGSSCKKEKEEEPKSSEKEIISFSIEEQIGTSTINSEAAAVLVVVPETTDKTSLTPVITVSDLASIQPASGEAVDFSLGPVVYTVTAEDESTKDWTITVADSTTLSNEAEIISFSIKSYQRGETVFEGNEIYVQIMYGINLAIISAEIEISEGAILSPPAEESDFSSGTETYTVTAENGSTKTWVAHISYAPNHKAEIESYTVPGQIGEASISDTTIYIEIDYGTDLSSIVPTILISEGATINPASGEPVDFSLTGRVEYLVVAENGTNSKTWGVYINYPLFKADNPYFKYVGRIDFSEPERPRTWTPGTYMTAKFTGSYCKIALTDEPNGAGTQNFVEVIIDNTHFLRYVLYEEHTAIDISEYLDEGEHTLMVCQTSETNQGYIEFLGLHLGAADALLPADDLPTRKIEIIGNSISVGSGIDLRLTDGVCGDWDDNHNAYYSYGAQVARSLDAQWMITARSGLGLIHSCCGNGFTLPEVYTRMKLEPNGPEWDFNKYIPDVVTICLGQNDGVQDSTAFCSAYVDFIGTIRGYYPDAYIICLNSPMADDYLTNALLNYLDGVVGYCNDQGDDKVLKFEVSHNFNAGCASHPDQAQHDIIADELTGFIQTTLGW